jgi:HAD superfamily hydrolase (TIGR01509 family)
VIRGLVFDFDGLILDTEVPVYRAWAEVYGQHGQELPLHFWATIIGYGTQRFDPVAELERRLGRSLDRDVVQAERRRREREMVATLSVLPGVHEWRDQAAAMGVRLGVASSSSRRWVVGHLERLGLVDWSCVRCSDDVKQTKPAPDLYLAVAACLGVAPREAIAVEDSATGVRSAKAAGLYCVAVPSALTASHDFSEADLVLGSLAETPFEEVAALAAGADRSGTE